jgi:hypothetical protein
MAKPKRYKKYEIAYIGVSIAFERTDTEKAC